MPLFRASSSAAPSRRFGSCLRSSPQRARSEVPTPSFYALRECVLEIERLDTQSRQIGAIHSISLEEFEFMDPKFSAADLTQLPVDFSPYLLKYEHLKTMLKEEVGFNPARDILYYIRNGMVDGLREVNSDITLRGAVRILRTGGGCILRLSIKKKSDFGITEETLVGEYDSDVESDKKSK